MERTEFDDLVDDLNSWLQQKRGWQWRLKNIMRGMMFLGPRPHPLYGNSLLTEGQKEAVALGSDVKRTITAIEFERQFHSDGWYEEAIKEKDGLYNLFKAMFHEH